MHLAPLLEPRSVAVVGASGRPGRPGHAVLAALRAVGFAGDVHPVTPGYPAIEGWACTADVADLPPVDLAVIAGAAARVPEQLAGAVRAGARAAYVLANCTASGAGEAVAAEVAALVARSGIPVLGPNSLGYVNVARGVAATWTPARELRPGPVALISQSGSTYSYANNLDPRIRFSFTAHAGQELSVGVPELVRYALDLEGTRVLALYLETAPDPDGLAAALAEADRRDVPVVAIRPGRSERARRQIESHAGRMAGADAGFEALFRAHGVARAGTVDEWWATTALLAAPRRVRAGGLGAITCSGGARALLLDDGDDLGVPFAELAPAARARLAELLGPGLPAENPVDVWDGQADLAAHSTAVLDVVAGDPATAIAIAFTDFGGHDPAGFPQSIAAACLALADGDGAPVAAGTYTSRQFDPAVMATLAEAGIPVLDGMRNAVTAVGHAFALRDRRARGPEEPAPAVDGTALRARLAADPPRDERAALALLAELGVPAAASVPARDLAGVLRAADAVGYPVVLKTAGAPHKSDVDGVRLGLGDAGVVAAAYAELSRRLGPDVVVARQAPAGVEIAVGVVRDPAFGPLLLVAAGGTLVEALDDRRFLLAPASPAEVRRALGELAVARQLAGARGRPPCDVDALARTISLLSAVGAAAGDALAELDVNPLIAGPHGCVAVDALLISGSTRE